MIDAPDKNDNRSYDYSQAPHSQRDEYPLIVDLVQEKSSVIDFGCGNGSLLKLLAEKKFCHGKGIDISPSAVEITRQKSFEAFCKAIDTPHTEFHDKQFDYAICNVTLQMVMYPEIAMREMARIARYQIISFPNFAHYRNRLDLLFRGCMPHPYLFGYAWYSTGHIHPFSNKDFEQFCHNHHFVIHRRLFAQNLNSAWRRVLIERFPNLFAWITVYLLEAKS